MNANRHLDLCVFTAINDEDCETWGRHYLTEMERLEVPYALHLDRCGDCNARFMTGHPLCVGYTVSGAARFDETSKQAIMDRVKGLGFKWGLNLDADEVLEPDALQVLGGVLPRATGDVLVFKWLTLWGDPYHIRVDPPFDTITRAKLYNLKAVGNWVFRSAAVNGPSLLPHAATVENIPLTCIHWGSMTLELRRQHKERWDRIYTAAVGRNPSHWWDWSLDEVAHPPTVVPNPYCESETV